MILVVERAEFRHQALSNLKRSPTFGDKLDNRRHRNPILLREQFLTTKSSITANHYLTRMRTLPDIREDIKYCSDSVNVDTSKVLTQKNKYPELGRRMLTQKGFGTILIIFLDFSISLILYWK